MTPSEKKARRARLLDLKASQATHEKAWKLVIEKQVAKDLNLPMLRNLLKILLTSHLDRHSTDGPSDRMKIKTGTGYNRDSGKHLAAWLQTNVSKEQVLTLAWQVAMGSCFTAEGGTQLTNSGKAVFGLAGVDFLAMKAVEAKRITAEREAKIKAKLAGTKPMTGGTTNDAIARAKKARDKSDYTNVVAKPSDIKTTKARTTKKAKKKGGR